MNEGIFECVGNCKKKISIEELLCQLEEFNKFRILTKYEVVESFKKNNHSEYILYNLSAVIEDGVVIFDDAEQMLEEIEFSVLSNFITLSVIGIEEYWECDGENYKYCAMINFNDGFVKLSGLIY